MHDNMYIMVESKNKPKLNNHALNSINLKDTCYVQCHYF